AISWNLTAPSDGVTTPCVASFTVSDVAFVNDTAAVVRFGFDTDAQGWAFSDFNDPASGITNLAVVPPPGGSPPTLVWTGADGDPAPGALRLTVGFTAFDQSVDAQVNLPPPGADLAGKTLHARVRLASGSRPQGAIQFHASTGPSFIYGSTFFNAGILASGQWVPIDLD